MQRGYEIELGFDFDVYARGDRKHFELIDRVESWIQEVQNTQVSAHFKLLAGLSVDVRRAQNREDLSLGRERDRPYDSCAGTLCGLYDIRSRPVQLALIVGLEADSDPFSLLFAHAILTSYKFLPGFSLERAQNGSVPLYRLLGPSSWSAVGSNNQTSRPVALRC